MRYGTALVALLVVSSGYAQTVIYVDSDVRCGDGLTWGAAFSDLQDAIDLASGLDGPVEIRVAGGHYAPTRRLYPGELLTERFIIFEPMTIRGGFAGFGAPDPDERDIDAYESILTGDLNFTAPDCCCEANLTPGCGDPDCEAAVCGPLPSCCETEWDEVCALVANSLCPEQCDPFITDYVYNVVWISVEEGVLLEGLTITGGRAWSNPDRGGGIFGGDLTLVRCRIEDNSAVNVAGGLYPSGHVNLVECTFSRNTATGPPGGAGGAMHIIFGSSVTALRCRFEDNEVSQAGGAIFNGGDGGAGGSLLAVDCVFSGNVSVTGGGALDNRPKGDATLVNCRFEGNSASNAPGGAIRNGGQLLMSNCTLVGNSTTHSGGGLFVGMGEASVANSVFWNNIGAGGMDEPGQIDLDERSGCLELNYNCVEGWSGALGGAGNIGDDPLFADSDLRLSGESPCIDAGHNNAIAGLADTDLDFNPRFADGPVDDTGCGIPVTVDMGAYEFQGKPFRVKLGDIDGDGVVYVTDFFALLGTWGPCAEDCCLADLDLDGEVGVADFLLLLGNWG